MPAQPLTQEQLDDAARLKKLFLSWQKQQREAGAPVSQEGAAEQLGFNQSSLSQYLNGKIPLNIDAARKFSDLLGQSLAEFSPRLHSQLKEYASSVMSDEPAANDSTPPLPPGAMRVVAADQDDEDFIQIPLVRLRLSAGVTGFQTEPEHDDEGTIGMRRGWVERNNYNPAKLMGIYVKGESMEPSLYNGDVVVVNTADTSPVNGAVYAVNYEGESVVKRLVKHMGQWWLSSDNADQEKFKKKRCGGTECIIIGKVVRKESDHV